MTLAKPSRKARLAKDKATKIERLLMLAETRHEVVARCAEYCELCRTRKIRELHHIISGTGRRRLEERFDTLIALCLECHAEVHASNIRALYRLSKWAHEQRFLLAATEVDRRIRKVEAKR